MRKLLGLIALGVALGGCESASDSQRFEIVTKNGTEYVNAESLSVNPTTGALEARVADSWGGHSVGQWPKGHWVSGRSLEGLSK